MFTASTLNEYVPTYMYNYLANKCSVGLVYYKILVNFSRWCMTFKGIVSRDFEWLHMILMDRIGVPDVPLEVYSFLKLHLHIAF